MLSHGDLNDRNWLIPVFLARPSRRGVNPQKQTFWPVSTGLTPIPDVTGAWLGGETLTHSGTQQFALIDAEPGDIGVHSNAPLSI